MGAKSGEVNKADEARKHCHFWVGGTKEVNDVTEVQGTGSFCSPARTIASAV